MGDIFEKQSKLREFYLWNNWDLLENVCFSKIFSFFKLVLLKRLLIAGAFLVNL